jgi:hypothetical protein
LAENTDVSELAFPSEADAQSLTEPAVLTVPRFPRPSPRKKIWTEITALAITDYFTPPLGAPVTKGGKVLIFDEDPGLLAATAIMMGAGEVEAVCSQALLADEADNIARLNNLKAKLKMTVAELPPFTKDLLNRWRESFDLVVINLSPYLAVKILKNAESFLFSDRGRLIISGTRHGGQLSRLIKAASRRGLNVIDSSSRDIWTVLTLAKQKQTRFPIWEWRPGDWLVVLSDDEKEALAEADKADRSRPRSKRLGANDETPTQPLDELDEGFDDFPIIDDLDDETADEEEAHAVADKND